MSAMLIKRKTTIYAGWTFLLSTKKPANNLHKNSMPAKLSDDLFRLLGEVAVFTVSERFHALPNLKLVYLLLCSQTLLPCWIDF